jgi:ribonuclease P protein component
MLNSKQRISQGLFSQILKDGRSFQSKSFSLRACPGKDREESAFSFVVPAKTIKTAIQRNFLKRRGRHVVKKHLARIKGGYLCAFFLKKEASKESFSDFEQEILAVLKTANLLK